jgi:hypothetical protein
LVVVAVGLVLLRHQYPISTVEMEPHLLLRVHLLLMLAVAVRVVAALVEQAVEEMEAAHLLLSLVLQIPVEVVAVELGTQVVVLVAPAVPVLSSLS